MNLTDRQTVITRTVPATPTTLFHAAPDPYASHEGSSHGSSAIGRAVLKLPQAARTRCTRCALKCGIAFSGCFFSQSRTCGVVEVARTGGLST